MEGLVGTMETEVLDVEPSGQSDEAVDASVAAED